MLYIFFSSIHPPFTLVSHPCLYLSACPIDYSLWRSVSCCGPHRTVQGSHRHQWDQGVSYGYLIQRWHFSWGCFSTMLLWLAYWTWNLLWDPQEDCLGRCGAFPFCDFGLPRTGSSSAVYSGSLDSLHSSSGTSSSSAWALDLIWNGPKSLDPFSPTIIIIITKKKQKTKPNQIHFLPQPPIPRLVTTHGKENHGHPRAPMAPCQPMTIWIPLMPI